ncbi:zinc finger protein 7-like isoform X7 [Mauremys reevesii]|uniref:zinc finger protein 7-like isoform X7 n=1 Tax=Mauremys reevesii TaxID=260615 RepID=UPI0019400517|nr:zinc finger protein 7-like isoform X7 [Mauremys reevesii]
MQENYETVTSLGFPIPKPELIARLERGEEPWVPDLRACEEKEIPKGTCTGAERGSENEEGNHHKDVPGEVEPQGSFVRRAERNFSQCWEQGEAWGNRHTLEKLLENHPGKTVDESINSRGGDKDPTAQETNPKEQTSWPRLQCGKGFIVRSQLVTHQTILTGEKPLQCLDRGESFNKLSDLNNHGRSYIGERSIQCLECEKCFSSKSALISHQESHTGEKPHKHLDCGKSFKRTSDLVNHQAIHTGQRSHSCLHCGKRFRQRSDLVSLERTHRREAL